MNGTSVKNLQERERERTWEREKERKRERGRKYQRVLKEEENVRNAFLMRNERWGCREWVDLREAWLAF